MFYAFITLTFLFSLNTHAAVVKHETLNAKYEEFPLKEVCEKLGAKNFELISAKSSNEIDCMGKIFKTIVFCLQKFPDNHSITRAIIDEKNKVLKCESASNVTLYLSCDQRDAKYCLNPKRGCEDLQKIYAVKLEIAHQSVVDKTLNCYFSKPLGDFDATN